MSQDRPCSEDSADVQRQLQRLRPRALKLDTERILQAAEQADSVAPVAHREAASRRSHRWVVFGAGWATGAAAGAVVTLLLLRAAASPADTSGGEVTRTSPHQAAVAEETGHQSPDTIEPRLNGREGAESGWSHTELLVSTELLGPYAAGTSWREAAPLRAGSYVRPRAVFAAGRAEDLAASPQDTGTQTPTSSAAAPRPVRPFSRDRLLDELLGRPPASL